MILSKAAIHIKSAAARKQLAIILHLIVISSMILPSANAFAAIALPPSEKNLTSVEATVPKDDAFEYFQEITGTPEPMETAVPVETTTPDLTPTVELTGTITPGLTETVDPADVITPTITLTPTLTPTPVISETENIPSPTVIVTPTETLPPVETTTPSPSPTPTLTPTLEVTETLTPTQAITPTVAPTQVISTTTATSFELYTQDGFVTPGRKLKVSWSIDETEFIPGIEIVLRLPNGLTFDKLPGNEDVIQTESSITIPIASQNGHFTLKAAEEIAGQFDLEGDLMIPEKGVAQVKLSLTAESMARVGPGGGMAHGLNGRVQIHVPQDVIPGLTNDRPLNVRVRPLRGHSSNAYPLSHMPFEILADQVSVDEEGLFTPVTHFDTPITITLTYSDEEIRGDETTLKMFYFDEEWGTWIHLRSWTDTESNLLTAYTDHFTAFDFNTENWEASRLPNLKDFQVSTFTGSGTYSFPIEVPPGPGGLQPSLALSYNSQVVDNASALTQASWVGMGWTLDTGYIQRNQNGTPNDLGDDIFTINFNGISSVLLKDTNGVYHTTEESFLKIQRIVIQEPYLENNEDSYWIVWDQTGTQYYFGEATEDEGFSNRARYVQYDGCSGGIPVNQKTVIWRWSLNRVKNIYGKELIYRNQNEVKRITNICDETYESYIDQAIYPFDVTYPNERYRISFVRQTDDSASGIYYRQDWDHSWGLRNSAQNFFLRSRLKEIRILHDSDGDGSYTDDPLIRKYVLVYTNELGAQPIFPNITWSEGGKSLTLARIEEYGYNGAGPLPKTTFTYGDTMHITKANNGYGGEVVYSYNKWGEANGPKGQTQEFSGFTFTDITSRRLMPSIIHPSGVYQITAEVIGISSYPTDQYVNLGLSDGQTDYWSSTPQWYSKYSGVTFTVTIALPANVFQSSTSYPKVLVKCEYGCTVEQLSVKWVPTYHRVSSKTLHDLVTGEDGVFAYSYDEPATNDADHSAFVASTSNDDTRYNPVYSEFRGHAMAREKGPDGRVSTTFFYQDDAKRGNPSVTMVGSEDHYQPFNQTSWTSYSSEWAYSGSTPSFQRVTGDVAAKIPGSTSSWETMYRSSDSLTNGDAMIVQFRLQAGTTNPAVLSIDDGAGSDYRRWGIYIKSDNTVVAQYTLDGANYPETVLYNSGAFQRGKWYVLLLFVDEANGFYTWIWPRDDPGQGRVYRHMMNTGRSWHFIGWTLKGPLYLDEYSEGLMYSLQSTSYLSGAPSTPDPTDRKRCAYGSTCVDLVFDWIRPVQKINYTFENSSVWTATSTYSRYELSLQNGKQYGNITNIIESRWNGSNFEDYRINWTAFWPNASKYLVSLPGYTNRYSCPSGSINGSCYTQLLAYMNSANYYGSAYLLTSHLYLYDGSTSFSASPTKGVLTAERSFIRFAGANYSDPRYSDVRYAYDTWGNRTGVTTYTTEGASSLASGGAQTTTTCFGGFDWSTGNCADDGYNTYPIGTINAAGHRTKITYDEDLGLPTTEKDPNGITNSVDYDAFGRLIQVLRYGDSTEDPTNRISYHNYTSSSAPFYTEATQRVVGNTYFKIRKYYNGMGQLIQTQVVGAKVGTVIKDILVDYYYDGYGRLIRQSVPYEVTTGSYYHTRNGSIAASYTNYDILGRTHNIIGTDGSTTSYTYSLLKTTVKDALNHSTITTFDHWGRTMNVQPPTGPSVSYTYDHSDRLVTAVRAGATTRLYYDYAGRKTSMNDPDMGSWSYGYDALGNLKTQTDARGCITTMSYDNLNRLTGKAFSGSGSCGTTAGITYTYDNYSQHSGYTGSTDYAIGRRTGMIDGTGRTMWTYDFRGRQTREQKVVGSETFVTSWAYNSADLTTSMTYPGGSAGEAGELVSFSYNPQLLIDRVYSSLDTYVNGTEYDAASRVDQQYLGNNGTSWVLKNDFVYYGWSQQGGRLNQIKTGTSLNTTSLQYLVYSYDAVGNITKIIDNKAGPQTLTFSYDALDRLTSATASGGSEGLFSESYTYDSNGRLSNKDGHIYAYNDNAHIHAVTHVDGQLTYSYDGNGNQASRPVAESKNLVINPGFESSSNWTEVRASGYPGTSFYRSTWGTADEHSDSYGYAISNHAYGYLKSDLILVSPNTEYDLYAWVRGEIDAEDSAGEWIIRAEFYDSSNTYICIQNAESGGPGSINTTWQYKGGRITIPDNAASMRVHLYNYMNSGWTAFDDVSLIRVGTATNLVVNPSFEDSTGWTEVRASGFPETSFSRRTWGTSSPKSGSYAFAISNHAYGYLQSSSISILPNTEYDLYAWVRGEIDGENSEGGWHIRAVFYTFTGAYISYQDAAAGGAETITTSWQRKGGRITTPSMASKIRVELYNVMSSGWVAFDDVSLRGPEGFTPDPTRIVTIDTSNEDVSINVIYPNLLQNPGFESSTGWTEVRASGFPGTSFSRRTWGTSSPNGGSYAYAISNHAYGNLQSELIPVAPSTDYSLYAWMRGEIDAEDSEGGWHIRAAFYDSSGVYISNQDSATGGSGTINNSWQQKGGLVTTPANAASMRIELYNVMSSGWVAFDDISLIQSLTVGCTLTYDAENHLINVKQGTSLLAEYKYDGDGNRVLGIDYNSGVESEQTVYIGNHYEKTAASGATITKSYYYAGGRRVAMRETSASGNQLSFLLSDHLGSTSITAGASGARTAELRYKPWGETRYTYSTTPTSFTFTGQRVESKLGLHFYNARWYDSQLGRFVQADPVVPLQSQGTQAWDRYAYVNNNPLSYTDPDGHIAWFATAAIGAAIGAVVGAVAYATYTTATGTEFNTGHMLLAAGGGAIAGGLIGTGVGIAAGMSQAAATSAAITGGSAAVTASTTVGDPTDEVRAVSQAIQSANQFWTSTTQFQGNLVYQRPDLINPNLTQGGLTNLQRMQQGLAPIGPDGARMQLHHMLQSTNGPIAEVTQTFHQTYNRIIHINPSTVGSGIDRVAFKAWRAAYWVNRAKDFIEQ